MEKGDLFKAATAAVGGLLAAYGGFFLHIQPPEQTMPAYSVGLASVLGTVAYLVIVLISRSFPEKAARASLTVLAVASLVALIASGVAYQMQFDKYTFPYFTASAQEVRLVSGSEMTSAAARIRRDQPNISDAELLAGFGGIRNKNNVWTEESINRRKALLNWGYISLVVSTCATVFSLLEVIGALNRK